MTADVNLSVKVQGDEIVVTLSGTNYVVTYYRAAAYPQELLTKSHSGREDQTRSKRRCNSLAYCRPIFSRWARTQSLSLVEPRAGEST